MDRRHLIKLLLGGATVGATGAGVTVKAAAAAIGVDQLTASRDDCVEAATPVGGGYERWRIRNVMESHRFAKSRPMHHMPAHLASKRSWSAIYKASQLAREEAIMSAFRQRLDTDDSFAEQVINAILGEN
jgi:hypothetical protein